MSKALNKQIKRKKDRCISPDTQQIFRDLSALEIDWPEPAVSAVDIPRYVDILILLDSGAAAHVIGKDQFAGMVVKPSEMSRRGGQFVAADGNSIKSYGETCINAVITDSSGQEMLTQSTLDVADVTRAIWSVGKICDKGYKVTFKERLIPGDRQG